MASNHHLINLYFQFLLLSTSLYITKAVQSQNCSVSLCGTNPFPIKFPFHLPNTSTRCTYPGFSLSCNTNQVTIHLPESGQFKVRNIDYTTQSIWITDPGNCFPKRLIHGFSLRDSPFEMDRLVNFTFVNCTTSLDAEADYGYYKVVTCMSGENYTVLAGPSWFHNESLMLELTRCVRVSTVVIPMPWGLWSGLEIGVGLVWRRPECGDCEENGLGCGFKESDGLETSCYSLSGSGISKKTKYGITLGIAIPALCSMVGFILYYIYTRIKYSSSRRTEPSTISSPNPQSSSVINLIESYPKTLLGESMRLPKLNDTTCSICLCEYEAKETIKTIPDCNHYFHVDCIDEWLKLKTTCPVCRNSSHVAGACVEVVDNL